jgi:hypothetical protein
MLLVFEAVPSLQRSGRNNQRRQDVQTILEAASHWELNHSANLPGLGSDFLHYSTLSYYNFDLASVKYIPPNPPVAAGVNVYVYPDAASSPLTIAPQASAERVDVHNYQKCDTNTVGASVSKGAGYNDVVALYALETAGAVPTAQCQQL